MSMNPRTRNSIIAVVIGLIVIFAGARQIRKNASRTREVPATITHIDLTTRTASAEVIHPETGGAMEITGQVPPECEITINGEPATLDDLRVKDYGLITGKVEDDLPAADGKPRKRVVPVSIHITRKGGAPQESRKIPVTGSSQEG